jgi:chromosome segregation ATPase
MELQEAYKQKLAAQLKEWSAQLDLLEAKAANAGADVKVKQAQELQALRAKLHGASEKMQALEKASGEAWEQLKGTADQVWEDLKAGFAEVHAKFK